MQAVPADCYDGKTNESELCPMPSADIAAKLEAVRQAVKQAAERFGRNPADVCVLAVSKQQPPSAIAAAADAGQADFGENYLQEALAKIATLEARKLNWHFIGAIQSNKTRAIAEHFSWVHTVERAKIAQRLDAQRPASLPPLNVCIQVNVSGEASKAGIAPDEADALAAAIAEMPHLRLRGLMTIPAPVDDFAKQRAAFHTLAGLFRRLRGAGHELDTLSMGMSGDFEAAIAEGATTVRIGTAIFGARRKAAP
jgi:pyridoxal phosphate enzyme (YggS family)